MPALSIDLLDEVFDDGADDAIALLMHEILVHGTVPIHPDGDRITTYDPVPLCGDDDRYREDPRPEPPKGPTADERRAGALSWLPANFRWLIGEEQWISQAEIEAFWIERRTRSVPWIGWGATRQVNP